MPSYSKDEIPPVSNRKGDGFPTEAERSKMIAELQAQGWEKRALSTLIRKGLTRSEIKRRIIEQQRSVGT